MLTDMQIFENLFKFDELVHACGSATMQALFCFLFYRRPQLSHHNLIIDRISCHGSDDLVSTISSVSSLRIKRSRWRHPWRKRWWISVCVAVDK
ncbi:hypothetical protein T10_7515 [Trichinella papuae]|uniref:Uncharacterized protein n=1 Tax=Trichinella papuae TaxID=268474 RepID=A0A0V1MES6_9BILA|nr:hypothetical protein T10_7515 [Trichinella papuae]